MLRGRDRILPRAPFPSSKYRSLLFVRGSAFSSLPRRSLGERGLAISAQLTREISVKEEKVPDFMSENA
jgi:hypothetical protein